MIRSTHCATLCFVQKKASFLFISKNENFFLKEKHKKFVRHVPAETGQGSDITDHEPAQLVELMHMVFHAPLTG